jgi:cytoskeletal protein CcmA (bactofilin family)
MVFRRDKQGGDAFQRQISALRQQLGGAPQDDEFEEEGPPGEPGGYPAEPYGEDERLYGFQPQYEEPESASAIEPYEPALPAIPLADAQVTVVSHDTVWNGEIDSQGSMHIHGRLDGVIRAKDDVYILEEATVAAEVNARNVVISGRYEGAVTCESRFEVLPTGRVRGNVRAPVLVVHDGAEINGSIQMTNLESVRPAPTPLVQRREATGTNQG